MPHLIWKSSLRTSLFRDLHFISTFWNYFEFLSKFSKILKCIFLFSILLEFFNIFSEFIIFIGFNNM
jgi:hypothetical protein